MLAFLGVGAMVRTITALVALLAATAAQADWQYTKWGMSESELTAISPNIQPTTASERQGHSNPHIGSALYKSGYDARDINFTAYYWFNAGQLVAVEIVPTNLDDGPKANLTLDQVYGAPIEDKSKPMNGGLIFCNILDRKWRSEREKNIITVSSLRCNPGHRERDFFSIRYAPILSNGSTGL
jgi:hypothetical protein